MGDTRFDPVYAAIAFAEDRLQAMRQADDEAIVAALAAASRESDPLLANVLATEAHNRIRRLRAALAHMAEGVLSLDGEGRIAWANPAAERLLHAPRESLIGRDVHQTIGHRDSAMRPVPEEACPVHHALGEGIGSSHEGEFFVAPDGTALCVAFTVAPIPSADGGMGGVVLVFRDFAAHRDRERELTAARERYESLFALMPLPVVSLDERGQILAVNQAASTLTGRAPAEAQGQVFTAFLHPDDVDKARRLFVEILRGATRSEIFRVSIKEDGYVSVQATGVPILTGGRVAGVHCLIEPTTTPR